jgi:hypothetical protein
MTQFSPQDAQAFIAHAETAPLAHLQHAQKVQDLLQRFADWFNALPEQEAVLRKEIADLKAKLGIDP